LLGNEQAGIGVVELALQALGQEGGLHGIAQVNQQGGDRPVIAYLCESNVHCSSQRYLPPGYCS
jgi:hypothetical protein